MHVIVAGGAVRAAADMLLFAYWPLYLYAAGETRIWLITLILAGSSAVRFVAAPFWGGRTDGMGRQRPALLLGLAGYVTLMASLPAFPGAPAAAALATALSFATSAFNPAAKAWLSLHGRSRRHGPRDYARPPAPPEAPPPSRQTGGDPSGTMALARWHQGEAGGYVVAGIALGALSGDGLTSGNMAVAAWTAAAALGAVGLMIFLKVADEPVTVGRSGPAPPARDGGRRSTGTGAPAAAPGIQILLFVFIASAAWELVASTFGMYFTDVAGGTPVAYGLTVSAATLTSVIVYPVFARWGAAADPRRLFAATAVGYTALYALLLIPLPAAAAIAYLVPMSPLLRTAVNAVITGRVPPWGQAGAMGRAEAAESLAAVAGPGAAGIIAASGGLGIIPAAALIISAALYLLSPGSLRPPAHRS